MQTSAYQALKLLIMDVVSLSKDAIHMHIGMGAFLVTVLVALARLGREAPAKRTTRPPR